MGLAEGGLGVTTRALLGTTGDYNYTTIYIYIYTRMHVCMHVCVYIYMTGYVGMYVLCMLTVKCTHD